MKRSMPLLLCAAILAGFFLGCGGSRWGRTPTAQLREPPMVQVLVARDDIPAGTVIAEPEILFVLRPFLAASLPADCLTDARQARNGIALRRLAKEMPCTATDFRFGGPELPSDRHAVTIQVTAAGQACDLVLPGSRVDLLRGMADPHDPERQTIKIFLQDV